MFDDPWCENSGIVPLCNNETEFNIAREVFYLVAANLLLFYKNQKDLIKYELYWMDIGMARRFFL